MIVCTLKRSTGEHLPRNIRGTWADQEARQTVSRRTARHPGFGGEDTPQV